MAVLGRWGQLSLLCSIGGQVCDTEANRQATDKQTSRDKDGFCDKNVTFRSQWSGTIVDQNIKLGSVLTHLHSVKNIKQFLKNNSCGFKSSVAGFYFEPRSPFYFKCSLSIQVPQDNTFCDWGFSSLTHFPKFLHGVSHVSECSVRVSMFRNSDSLALFTNGSYISDIFLWHMLPMWFFRRDEELFARKQDSRCIISFGKFHLEPRVIKKKAHWL